MAGRDFVNELPEIAGAIADGAFDIRAEPIPLAEVEEIWTGTADTSHRIVLVP